MRSGRVVRRGGEKVDDEVGRVWKNRSADPEEEI